MRRITADSATIHDEIVSADDGSTVHARTGSTVYADDGATVEQGPGLLGAPVRTGPGAGSNPAASIL